MHTDQQTYAQYEKWLNHAALDESLRSELQRIAQDPEAIEDRFYKSLEFGTAGMRGVIGAGTNRMNIYTVRRATQGLAAYLRNQGETTQAQGVVIAYDCRHRSPEFADEAARVLAQNGIRAYIFESLRPTPELSFAVRTLGAAAGIVITASHNPPEYNGYKVYGPDGCQMVPQMADEVTTQIERVPDPLTVDVMDSSSAKAQELYSVIGREVDDQYQEALASLSLNRAVIEAQADNFRLVYTPLHGTGYQPVRDGLHRYGFKHVHIVAEQADPDPEFSTVASPNPEEHAAFTMAIAEGERIGADILLATDPDADRVGVAVQDETGRYSVLSGNQLGGLLLEYLLSQHEVQGTLPANGVMIKTIVTSDFGRAIAAKYGVQTIETLTGFKFIGEKMAEFEQSGTHTFLFGYEESYGYLIGDFVRDKDAVQTCLLAAEMAAYYKAQGVTLYEQLQRLFATYGYYREDLESLTFTGKAGAEKMEAMINQFRSDPPPALAGQQVILAKDYLTDTCQDLRSGETTATGLPKANVLHYTLADGSWFCIRPSGTEPKVKLYFAVQAPTDEAATEKLTALKQDVMDLVEA